MRLAVSRAAIAAAVFLCAGVHSPAARADITVLPTDSDEARPAFLPELVRAAETELRSAGDSVVGNDIARTRFEERASSAPAHVSASDLDALPVRSQSAVRNLALGKYGAAREDLRVALDIADRGLDEISREEKRARGVVDACLFMVRAYLEGGNERQAKEQVLRCRRMFPDTEPTSQQLHTPEVRALVKEADQELLHGPHGSLLVESTPRGCAVRMNGKRMGTTPARIEDLAVHDYRIQVECDPNGAARGRVYTVALAAGENRVKVDVPFDSAVSSQAELRLSYRTDAERDAYRFAHAVRLGDVLGVREMWLVAPELDAARVRIDRVDVAGKKVLASVSVAAAAATQHSGVSGDSAGVDAAAVRQAVTMLREGISARIVGAKVEPAKPWAPPAPAIGAWEDAAGPAENGDGGATRATDDAHDAPGAALAAEWRVVGLAVGIAGVGALTAGVILHAGRSADADGLSSRAASEAGYLAAQDAWLGGRTLPIALGVGGGTALTAGLALALPGTDGMPWWGWVSGALGLGLGMAGVAELARGDVCDGDAAGLFSRRCLDGEFHLSAGALLVSGAVPLLSAPLISVLRGTESPAASESAPPPVTVNAEVTATGLILRLGGAL